MGYANGVGPRGDQGLDKKIEQFGLRSDCRETARFEAGKTQIERGVVPLR